MDPYEELLSQTFSHPVSEETLQRFKELRDLLRAAGARDPAIHQAVADLADALEDGGTK